MMPLHSCPLLTSLKCIQPFCCCKCKQENIYLHVLAKNCIIIVQKYCCNEMFNCTLAFRKNELTCVTVLKTVVCWAPRLVSCRASVMTYIAVTHLSEMEKTEKFIMYQ